MLLFFELLIGIFDSRTKCFQPSSNMDDIHVNISDGENESQDTEMEIEDETEPELEAEQQEVRTLLLQFTPLPQDSLCWLW